MRYAIAAQGAHGLNTRTNTRPGCIFQFMHTGNRLIKRMGNQRSKYKRHTNFKMVFLRGIIRQGSQNPRLKRRFTGMPKSFNRRNFGRLLFIIQPAQHISQRDNCHSGDNAKQCRHTERTRCKLPMLTAQKIKSANPHHKHCGRNVTRNRCVYKLGLCIWVKNQIYKAFKLHPHGFRIKMRTFGHIHPGIGN